MQIAGDNLSHTLTLKSPKLPYVGGLQASKQNVARMGPRPGPCWPHQSGARRRYTFCSPQSLSSSSRCSANITLFLCQCSPSKCSRPTAVNRTSAALGSTGGTCRCGSVFRLSSAYVHQADQRAGYDPHPSPGHPSPMAKAEVLPCKAHSLRCSAFRL